MAESPMDLAIRYLDGNTELRSALGMREKEELELQPLAQGEHNANFIFAHPETGEQLVLRINFESQLGLDDQIGYEAAALEALAPSGRVPQLRYVDGSKERIGHGVLVMEFLEGRHLDFSRPADLEEVARILADIHSVQPGAGCTLQQPKDPLAAQLDTARGFFDRYCASRFADPLVIRYVDDFFNQAMRAAQEPANANDSGHIQNTEAVPSHFLIRADAPGSMVDWEKPVIGEVAQDIAYFMSPTSTIWDTDYLFDPPARRRFLDAYWEAVDGRILQGRFEERYPAFVMSNALIGITWSCNALVDYADPDRPLKNAETAELLNVYVSEAFLERVRTDCFVRKGF